MITNLPAGAASCTGTWQQRWNCGWNKPVMVTAPRTGYPFRHDLVPALAVLAVVLLIARFIRKRRKARPAPAGAGSRR